MADCRITTDPDVQSYCPYVYDDQGVMTDLKPFEEDPRCLYGWGPPSHGCSHEPCHADVLLKPMPGVLTIAERIQHHRCRWCEWHPIHQGHHPDCPRPRTNQKEGA